MAAARISSLKKHALSANYHPTCEDSIYNFYFDEKHSMGPGMVRCGLEICRRRGCYNNRNTVVRELFFSPWSLPLSMGVDLMFFYLCKPADHIP